MFAAARPYLAVVTVRFSLLLQYRTAALAGFSTQLWWGLIKVLVLAAFYKSAPHQPLTLSQAITYVWMGQAFLAILPWFADAEIAQMAETGNVGYERLRPIDTYAYWFARALAWKTAPALLRAVPMFLVTAIALPLAGLSGWSWRAPAGPVEGAMFAASMMLTILLSAAITTLINTTVTALRTGRVAGLFTGLVTVLSGMVVPLALLPGWMQRFMFWQPFAGLVDIPYRIYFGNLAGADARYGLIAQALWIVVFVILGRALMARVMARIDMQGG
ncbi:MAG: ABC transporter permease [Alphaproteobacteria bacterium]|nr:ABC transporter permease [Alphaproteobacteria bacterium]